MNLLVTGAAGFLGRRLIDHLLAVGEIKDKFGIVRKIERITAFDIVPWRGRTDSRVEAVVGNIGDRDTVDSLIDSDTHGIFHLAAVVSRQAEDDFDLGMKINFDATRALMDRIRRLGTCPRIVTTSSVAVFGGELPMIVDDSQVWAPYSSYGTEKAISDLLLADYSRRGFLDGVSLRMPTIVVRPGKPNMAASSFASSIIREPLHGVEAICPVLPETILWLMSPDRAIANLVHGHELTTAQLGNGRIVNMPGLSISVQGMVSALREIAGDSVADRIIFERDPLTEAIVTSWPGNFVSARAKSLGFVADLDFSEIIRAFLADKSK